MTRHIQNLAILLLMLGYVLACSTQVPDQRRQQVIIDQGKKPNDTPTPALIGDALAEQKKAQESLTNKKDGAIVRVEGLEPGDPQFPQKKEQAVAKIQEASTHLDNSIDKTTTAHESSTRDVKEKAAIIKKLQKYEAADPVLAWLNLIAVVCIAFGAAGIVASFLLPSLLPTLIAPHVRAGGVALLVYGFFMAALAEFLDETRLIFWLLILGALAVGLVWAVMWAIRNRKRFIDSFETIQKGVAAGEIIITDKAKDPNASVMKAYQSTDTAVAIEEMQKKWRAKNAPVTPQHIIPAMSTNDAPTNIQLGEK